MKIQVLGSGCTTCKNLYKNVQDVVKKMGLDAEVEYSTDVSEIVKLGVMSSPVFAIDGQVLTAGKPPSIPMIEEMIMAGKNNDSLKKDAARGGGCSCGGNC